MKDLSEFSVKWSAALSQVSIMSSNRDSSLDYNLKSSNNYENVFDSEMPAEKDKEKDTDTDTITSTSFSKQQVDDEKNKMLITEAFKALVEEKAANKLLLEELARQTCLACYSTGNESLLITGDETLKTTSSSSSSDLETVLYALASEKISNDLLNEDHLIAAKYDKDLL